MQTIAISTSEELGAALATTTDEQQQAAVNARAQQIISSTCQKHGIDRAQLTQAQIDDAHRAAKEQIEREAAQASNPYYAETERLREELRLTQMQLSAVKQTRTNAANDKQPVVTVEQARVRLGEYEWNHNLTSEGRLQAIGVDPASVTADVRQQIIDTFGPKTNGAIANDLFRADAGKYRRLKEIGKALRII